MIDGSGIVNYVLTIARENQKQESGPTTLQVTKASWCYMAEPTRNVWFVLGRLASNFALNLRVMAITNHGNRRSGRKVFRYPRQLPTEARFGGDAARCSHRWSFQMFLFRSTSTQYPVSPSPGTSNKTIYVRLNPKAVLLSLNFITHTEDCF